MGNAHAHLNKLKQQKSGGGGSFQTEGSRIMQLAELLRPHIAQWLQHHKNHDGLPVQPATIRGVALNAAQTLIKQSA